VALGAVPLSLLADRWSRVKSIFLMALVWSLATISCAFAASYSQLLTARSVIGLGEAAYGTVGAAFLATLFPMRMRSSVLGAFFLAAILGSVLGIMLGGLHCRALGLAGRIRRGRRARARARVRVPVRGPRLQDRRPARRERRTRKRTACGTHDRGLAAAAALSADRVRRRRFQLLTLSMTYAWLPTYFTRYYGIAPDLAGAKAALVVLVGGVGALIWGVVADRLTPRFARARLFVRSSAPC
jgi:MFS family permease